MMMPCMGCDRREPGCHDTCEDYKQVVEELEKIKDRRKQDMLFARSVMSPKTEALVREITRRKK